MNRLRYEDRDRDESWDGRGLRKDWKEEKGVRMRSREGQEKEEGGGGVVYESE